ncbi:hypothetical protein HYDPIDRAFT_25717 [Hydnomerulius pinastri MD-312]|nr:hypothetical protein HYDPIDRAFT_25717 [Hydnomerulius pinastri MD-312]
MGPNINITTAFLTGLITLSLFYGIYIVLFIASIYVLVFRRKTAKINYIILGGTVLQFVLITVGYAIRWDRIYTAFITNGDQPQGPLLFFAKLDDWRELSSTAIWAMTSALGDIMFARPLLLLAGSLTTGIGLLVVLNRPLTQAYTVELTHWVWAFLSCNLAQNLLVTALIVARIWRVNIQSSKFVSGGGLWSVIVVLLESGALYSSSVLIFLVTYVCQNNAAMIMTDAVMPIMGITFTLIIVRVGFGFSKSTGTTVAGGVKSSTLQWRTVDTVMQHEPPYPLRNLAEQEESDVDRKIALSSSSDYA